MGEVNVCRICLMDDVNMHNLYSYPLESCYKLLVGENTLTSYLPITVCYLCAAQLRKLYSFKGKCLRAQAALTRVLHSCGGITSDFLKQIDRQNLQLTNNLIIQKVPNISIVSEVFDIKEEPLEDADSNYFDEKESVKLEDGFDDLAPLSTDDDEPLSVHKEKKEESGRKKRRNRRTEETQPNNTEEQFKYDIEVEIAEPSAIVRDVPEAAVRRKRGRPRKNDAGVKNMEKTRRTRNTGGVLTDDIALENYCTVIKLSEEDQKEEVNKRQQSSNYLNALYQCTLCYKGFIDADAWKHHIGKHDPSAGDIECPICKFRFKTKRTLQKHSANHEKKYACKSCPYVSKTTTQAKQHQRWHKGVTYKCQYCEEILTKWTSYLSHVRMKHPSEFICGVCGYSFVSKLGLNMHKTMMHKDVVEKGEVEGGKGKEDTPYCERCDVRFVSVEAFKRHMVTSVKHTQSTDFNNGCRMCGESFPDAEALRVHHRRAHARKRPHNYGKKPSALTWPTNCVHCSEEMANARVYWAHFRRAHPDKNYPIQKNYVCDICGKSFRGNAFLVYHKRTHFEERAYKCQQCPKAFFNRTNLQMHEKTHSEHRPHACTVCAKAFKCKGALDRHFRCHTGVKPYECEVCGKAFAQSNSRKLHVATVHLKQPSPYISRSRQERRNKTQPHKDLHGAPQFLY